MAASNPDPDIVPGVYEVTSGTEDAVPTPVVSPDDSESNGAGRTIISALVAAAMILATGLVGLVSWLGWPGLLTAAGIVGALALLAKKTTGKPRGGRAKSGGSAGRKARWFPGGAGGGGQRGKARAGGRSRRSHGSGNGGLGSKAKGSRFGRRASQGKPNPARGGVAASQGKRGLRQRLLGRGSSGGGATPDKAGGGSRKAGLFGRRGKASAGGSGRGIAGGSASKRGSSGKAVRSTPGKHGASRLDRFFKPTPASGSASSGGHSKAAARRAKRGRRNLRNLRGWAWPLLPVLAPALAWRAWRDRKAEAAERRAKEAEGKDPKTGEGKAGDEAPRDGEAVEGEEAPPTLSQKLATRMQEGYERLHRYTSQVKKNLPGWIWAKKEGDDEAAPKQGEAAPDEVKPEAEADTKPRVAVPPVKFSDDPNEPGTAAPVAAADEPGDPSDDKPPAERWVSRAWKRVTWDSTKSGTKPSLVKAPDRSTGKAGGVGPGFVKAGSRGGGSKMSDNPIGESIEPDGMLEYAGFLEKLDEAAENDAASASFFAEIADTDLPVEDGFREATQEFAAAYALVAEMAAEMKAVFGVDHERELELLENPRAGEHLWDQGNN